MKSSISFVTLASSLFVFAGVLTLSGCAGFGPVDEPTTTQVTPGAISGSVYGGHAPVVGAHVFVLEAETTT